MIGDIHGCYAELQDLLELAGLSEEDAIIALGDIVDRGPDTPGVLDFFHQRSNARTLMGNHERKHIRSFQGELKPAVSQIVSRQQLGDTYLGAIQFMGTFPTWIDLPEAILVHGYFEAGVPLDEQRDTVLCGTMGGEHYLSTKYDRPWYEMYDGEKPLIFGHHNYLKSDQPLVYQDRAFGLDTSCVNGMRLTGMLLPEFRIISVQSRADYWSKIKAQYQERRARNLPGRKVPRPKAPVVWDEMSERALGILLEFAANENARVLGRLREQPGFDELAPRQQATAYSVAIGDTPLATLLHLERREELDLEKARKVLKTPAYAITMVDEAVLHNTDNQ